MHGTRLMNYDINESVNWIIVAYYSGEQRLWVNFLEAFAGHNGKAWAATRSGCTGWAWGQGGRAFTRMLLKEIDLEDLICRLLLVESGKTRWASSLEGSAPWWWSNSEGFLKSDFYDAWGCRIELNTVSYFHWWLFIFQVALSLILSLLLFKPAPLYILDEVIFRIHGLWGKVTLILLGRALKKLLKIHVMTGSHRQLHEFPEPTCVHLFWIALNLSCFRLTLPLTFPTLKILGRCWKTISRYFCRHRFISNSCSVFSAQHSQFIVVSLKDGMFNNANVLFRYFINTNSHILKPIFITPHADLFVSIKDQVCWWDVNSEQDSSGPKQEEKVKVLPSKLQFREYRIWVTCNLYNWTKKPNSVCFFYIQKRCYTISSSSTVQQTLTMSNLLTSDEPSVEVLDWYQTIFQFNWIAQPPK